MEVLCREMSEERFGSLREGDGFKVNNRFLIKITMCKTYEINSKEGNAVDLVSGKVFWVNEDKMVRPIESITVHLKDEQWEEEW